MSTEVVIYRHQLNRAPTLEDRAKGVGEAGFTEELIRQGWLEMVNSHPKALKPFVIEYSTQTKKGDNYIEWKATLCKP